MSMRDKIERAIQLQPCTVKDLKAKFGADRESARKVMEALDELVREAVVCQKEGVFFTVRSGRKDKALVCTLVKLGKNFGFAMLEDGTGDIFIPGRMMKGSMPGDRVLVEKLAHPRVEGSDEGEILAVLEEKNNLVGTTRRVSGRLVFVPDDCPAITMPIVMYARYWQTDQEMLYRALVVGNLLSVHQKKYIGSLSAYCGATSAATGAACGIAYLLLNRKGEPERRYKVICDTITNSIETLGGMVCDGAKASCAAKIGLAVENALMALELSLEGNVFQPGEGMTMENPEDTIAAVGRMGRVGMKSTDVEILNIMLGN